MQLSTRKYFVLLLTLITLLTAGCTGKKEGAENLKDYISSVQKAESGTTREIKPGDDYITMLEILQPGDEIVFHEGTYEFPFRVKVSGTEEKPVIIRGYGKGEKRPVFLYEESSTNLCEIYGNNLVLAYMEFQPVAQDVHAIRIKPEEGGVRSNITIENCVFRNSGGGSIDANIPGGNYDNIRILNNRFIDVRATPVYIGEHAGTTQVSNFLFEGNFIDASKIVRDDVVGYGIELKLNVKGGIIRNNLIINSKGPGIMVYGASEGTAADANIVEGNIVAGSRTNPGIVVGSGPAVVRNNIVAGCPGGGISASNYGKRNLFENVILIGNTMALNDMESFYVDEGYRNTSSLEMEDNLVITAEGASRFESFNENSVKGVKGNEKLANLVKSLRESAPGLAELKDAWKDMKQGPFDSGKVEKIIDKLLK